MTAYEDPTGNGFDDRSLAARAGWPRRCGASPDERGVLYADAESVARAGGDGLHLTLDSHEPLAGPRDVARSVRARRGARSAPGTARP